MALTDSDKIRLIEDHCRSFWEGDLQDFDRQLSSGFVDTGARLGFPAGAEGAKAWARACRQASPHKRVVITDALVAGDVVAVRATWSGTDTGQFPNQPPTEDQTELAGLVVWELDEQGRIVRRTGFGVFGGSALRRDSGDRPDQRSIQTREGGMS